MSIEPAGAGTEIPAEIDVHSTAELVLYAVRRGVIT